MSKPDKHDLIICRREAVTYILDALGLSLLVLTPIAYGWKPDGAPLHLWLFYTPGIVLVAIAHWR